MPTSARVLILKSTLALARALAVARRVTMRPSSLIATLLLLGLSSSGGAEEERLIGWLGEVPREASSSRPPPPARVSGGADPSDPSPPSPPASSQHDASKLDTDGIGANDPNVEKLSDSPRAFLYRGFLTPEECAHIISVGEPHLHRSTVVGNDDRAGEDAGLTNDVRTSFGMFLPKAYDDVVSRIERRVEAFSGLSYDNQEQLQLLRYMNGQQYKDHLDGLASPNGGRRIATVLMFLHEPEEGGETSFPMAKPSEAHAARLRAARESGTLGDCAWRDGRGMAVTPRLGDAILFFSFARDGRSDPASMHASCPTVRGVKWTATKWIHERAFETGVWTPPTCADEVEDRCEGWAKAGECKNNPGFMLGAETPGKCLRSCCAGGAGVALPDELTMWQLEFCASCPGTKHARAFAEARRRKSDASASAR